MLKIVIVSDSHNNFDVLENIVRKHPDADYYYHLGDSEAEDVREIEPFVSVRGNNDYSDIFPSSRQFKLSNKTFYMEHGHHIFYGDYHSVLAKAKEKGADIICFGHTHRYLCLEVDGILILNPGSCYYNRDYTPPCYVVMYLNDDGSYRVDKETITI